MLTDWPRSFTALVAASTSSMDMPATKRLERRLPMEVFSAIARMDLLSDNQMKKARSKLTFVPQDWENGHVTKCGRPIVAGLRHGMPPLYVRDSQFPNLWNLLLGRRETDQKLLNALFGSSGTFTGNRGAAQGGADDLLRRGGSFKNFVYTVVDRVLECYEIGTWRDGQDKRFREDQADNAAQSPPVTFFADAGRDDHDLEKVLRDGQQSGGQIAGHDGGDVALHESSLQRRQNRHIRVDNQRGLVIDTIGRHQRPAF